MRTHILAILFLVTLGGGLIRAQETIGSSILEADEQAGLVQSRSETEADYDTYYYYTVTLEADMWNGHGGAQGCYMVEENEAAVCGFDFQLVPGYEYVLQSDHSLTAYFRVYQVDPYCDWGCNLWYDAYGYSNSVAPCGRDEDGEPNPCGPEYEISEWVWHSTCETGLVLAFRRLGETSNDVKVPWIDSISPSTVAAGRSSKAITISGGNFGASPSVSIPSVREYSITAHSDTSITVSLNTVDATLGDTNVKVTNNGMPSNVKTLTVICPYPTNFRQVSSSCGTDATLLGTYQWDASTGDRQDLAACTIREAVRYPEGATMQSPPFPVLTFVNPTLRPGPATNEGLGDTNSADPPGSFVKPYSYAPFNAKQSFEYLCSCSNSDWTAFTGFRDVTIKREVLNEYGTWKFRISKQSNSCTMDLPQP